MIKTRWLKAKEGNSCNHCLTGNDPIVEVSISPHATQLTRVTELCPNCAVLLYAQLTAMFKNQDLF